ncbi:MAG: ribonuclease H family protein [Gloeomargarita sp. SKYG116]|nr:ribonuclease H family protein [Gloeomargarita sp. SKYG116]MDW8402054.1 ribonuclease H family protein [Gloeomargarita sp. SKYGB_i_bin116]
MTRNKVYVVWRGRKPGIYRRWDECWAQVGGYSGAQYKAYPNWEMARQAFAQGQEGVQPSLAPEQPVVPYLTPSYAVDGACSGNPGVMEYRGVNTVTGEEIFRRGPYPWGTNNIAEFLAIVTALQWCAERGCDWPIYSDSDVALGWVKKKRCGSQLPVEGTPLGDEIRAAEAWLQTHTYPNPLYKWDTERWGQIPADFGRK